MTLLSLTDCCRLLAIDGKTLRRWLAQAQLSPIAHPSDARIFGITSDQLRRLATAHHRSLPARPAQESPPLPPELLDLLQRLCEVPAQLAAVQQQLTLLTHRLEQPSSPSVVTAARSQHTADHVGQPSRRKASARPRPAAASQARLRRAPAHVLALVEYASDGHYVVICPSSGLLSLEPDTPEWFAWLATLSSFRFVGKLGRLTAHRELERVKRAPWRAHRKVRNHTYNLSLGPTEDLTIAVLEQAAATLQAHLF